VLTKLYNLLSQNEITAQKYAAACLVCGYIEKHGGSVRVNFKLVASMLECSPQHIGQAVSILVENGVLKKERNGRQFLLSIRNESEMKAKRKRNENETKVKRIRNEASSKTDLTNRKDTGIPQQKTKPIRNENETYTHTHTHKPPKPPLQGDSLVGNEREILEYIFAEISTRRNSFLTRSGAVYSIWEEGAGGPLTVQAKRLLIAIRRLAKNGVGSSGPLDKAQITSLFDAAFDFRVENRPAYQQAKYWNPSSVLGYALSTKAGETDKIKKVIDDGITAGWTADDPNVRIVRNGYAELTQED